VKHFLPHFITGHYRAGITEGYLTAYTMFVDLSGFTRLTDTLMQKGPAGAEELSVALNEIFTPTVRLVYEQGGFIPYFAGDSFTAIFQSNPDHPHQNQQVLATAQAILERFRKAQVAGAPLASYQIGIKIGLSFGIVHWGIVGERRKAYYFRGQPIDNCGNAQGMAESLGMVGDAALVRQFTPDELKTTPIDEQWFRLSLPGKRAAKLSPQPVRLPDADPAILVEFLPELVFNGSGQGEFRQVTSVFLSFSGVDTHEGLQHLAATVLDHSLNFGAYFKEIDFGDKGGLMLCLFGAPVTFENNIERALEFATALQEDLRHLEALTGARFRMGITSGIAFTGVVGGPERSQYAAVGARVNLAARLMAEAAWGEIVVDDNVQRNRNFKFVFRGERAYKGFETLLPSYQLTGRSVSGRSNFGGGYVGRATELNQLVEFAQPLLQQRFSGVAYVFGEAGIGKSRISYELRRTLRDGPQSISWFNCQSDQILRKPFNPFIALLKNYFEQSPENNDARNRDLFEQNLQQLLHELDQMNAVEAQSVRREIARTRTVLEALVGIHQSGGLWEQLDARGRYQNALAALANLLIAEAMQQPVVIELEDTHWYDEMSREFLGQFIRRCVAYPIMFLASSRYEDDGSKSYPFRPALLTEIGVDSLEIDLNFLQPADLRAFAEARLGETISEELFELLQRMTQGNPFYLEQMADYFLEADMLQQSDGALQLKNKDIQISDSVKQVMMARIDRLSGLVRETVKAAAVIGREFELPVLSAVMARQEEFVRKNGDLEVVLREQVQTAEKWQIWHAMNELRYIFRHSLLREAAYDMQLRARLRELHQSIAEAIEQLYPGSEERFVDLAFHYEQAENEKKTIKYLEKAARYAQRNFQNRQALGFYEKLLQHIEVNNRKSKKRVKFLLRKGAVHELIGQWDEAEKEYAQALERARLLNDWLLIGRSHRRSGQLLMLRGNYEEAKRHLDIAVQSFELADDQVGTAKTFGNLGTLFFRQGNYESAKSWFAKSIEMNRSLHRDAENAPIVANLGLIYMNQGHYDEGIRWLEEQKAISERAQDKQGLNTLYTNLGIIYLEKNSLDSALLCLEKGLALSEELGNKLTMTICIGCIGSVWEKKGDYTKAMQNFERDLALVREMGDKQGLAIACGLIGDLMSVMGDFEQSNQYTEENLRLSRELKYKKGIAKALNTLGDNWYFLGDYQRSIGYYNEAIEYSREMGNRLVLGYSLLEKGAAHLRAGEISPARQLLEEGRDIALSLGNADLSFEANILRAQITQNEGNKPEALRLLSQMLALARNEREEAAVHYELRLVADQAQTHRERALEIYEELYRRTPQYIYRRRMERIRSESIESLPPQ
jgi:predicted ATPase/class 3 adenylate cyclase